MTQKPPPNRDHGGGIDAALQRWGGRREDWIDLSTGINPVPYPIPDIDAHAWQALPDSAALTALLDAARALWKVPDGAEILAAPGASALIAALPSVLKGTCVDVPQPTYNEHLAAFCFNGWTEDAKTPDVRVLVHPNNPDGKLWTAQDLTAPLTLIDESFADTCPEKSLIDQPGCVTLKSFGKFWGLAGVRLGFAIGAPETIAALKERIGPWAVSGPALAIATHALQDKAWAQSTRQRLAEDAQRLDALMLPTGAKVVGGCSLFRLYDTPDAAGWRDKLAQHHILSRIFPYSDRWLRLGLPAPDDWPRVEKAISG